MGLNSKLRLWNLLLWLLKCQSIYFIRFVIQIEIKPLCPPGRVLIKIDRKIEFFRVRNTNKSKNKKHVLFNCDVRNICIFLLSNGIRDPPLAGGGAILSCSLLSFLSFPCHFLFCSALACPFQSFGGGWTERRTDNDFLE